MKDEYAEWRRLKFTLEVVENKYYIKSVDFGAVPIAFYCSKSLSMVEVRMKILKRLNKYNKVLRWNSKNAGDTSILKKQVVVRDGVRTYYRFKNNQKEDIEIITKSGIYKPTVKDKT